MIDLLSSVLLAKISTGVVEDLGGNKNRITGLDEYLPELFKFGLKLGAILATLVVVSAGYLYMTSRGNSQAAEKAKELLTGAFVGLVVIIFASLLTGILGV